MLCHRKCHGNSHLCNRINTIPLLFLWILSVVAFVGINFKTEVTFSGMLIYHKNLEDDELIKAITTERQIEDKLQNMLTNLKNYEGDELTRTISTIEQIEEILQNNSRSLMYENALESADLLLKVVESLKSDLQIGAASASAKPSSYCNNRTYECNLDQLVTIVMNLVKSPPSLINRLPIILRAIQKEHPKITVYVGVRQKSRIHKKKFKGQTIKVRLVRLRTSDATEMWNQLVRNAPTPYVLISRNLLHFDKNAFLHRQVRALLTSDAAAVGGATRDLAGFWRAECYQMTVGVYTLKFEEGYRRSMQGCMKCDYIGGPFVIEKHNFDLNADFKETEAFVDFFFRLLEKNTASFVCPEVMYYQKQKDLTALKTRDLEHFAIDQHFDTYYFPKQTLEISCSKLKYNCSKHRIFQGLSVPRCCPRGIVNGLVKLDKHFQEHNILYYIRSGVLLTGVKARDVVTWDCDADVEVSLEGMQLLLENNTWLEKQGYKIFRKEISKERIKFKLLYDTTRIELWYYLEHNMPNTTLNLPHDLRFVQTKVKLGKKWFNSVVNPGLYGKTVYGNGYLRHQHRHQYTIISFKNFKRCPSKQKQQCISYYPSDGNLDLFP